MFFRPQFVNTSKKRVLVQIESLAGENVCELRSLGTFAWRSQSSHQHIVSWDCRTFVDIIMNVLIHMYIYIYIYICIYTYAYTCANTYYCNIYIYTQIHTHTANIRTSLKQDTYTNIIPVNYTVFAYILQACLQHHPQWSPP